MDNIPSNKSEERVAKEDSKNVDNFMNGTSEKEKHDNAPKDTFTINSATEPIKSNKSKEESEKGTIKQANRPITKKKKLVTKEKLQLKSYYPEIDGYVEQPEEQFVEQPQEYNEVIEDKPKKERKPGILTGDISKLDIRVGKIKSIVQHPFSSKYYVNHVVMGTTNEKPSITKLRPHYKKRELKNKLVVVVRNVKNRRHFLFSFCFILFAESGDKLELLEPPSTSVLGEKVRVPGYVFRPSVDRFIKPRKEGDKLLQSILTEFRVNSEGIVEYRGIPLRTASDGLITAPTLRDCAVSK